MPAWVKAALPGVALSLVVLVAVNRLAFLSKVKALINGPSA